MTVNLPRLRLSLLATALTATPALAQSPPDESLHVQRSTVSLGSALGAFAAEHGVALSFDPALTRGRQAPSIATGLDVDAGFDALLHGSGLRAVRRADGSYTLQRAQVSAGARRTSTLHVPGQDAGSTFGGSLQLDRSYVAAQAAGNGDITRLLRIHPAVQFDNADQGSFSPGEIRPAEISINGAKFYQNAFIVDGMNFNNDIDPGADPEVYRLFSVPGGSQALALDSSLLEDVTVHDSNVSAAYGGFNGGVVEASTRRPSRAFSGRLSTQSSRSSWTRYHLDSTVADSYQKASGANDGQPDFKKTTTRADLEGYLTDRIGVLASFTRKRSTIPTYNLQSHLVDDAHPEKQIQRRSIDNLFVKAVWEASDTLDIEASFTRAPEESHYFRSNVPGAGIDIIGGGRQAMLKATWSPQWGTLTQQVGWSSTEQSRHPQSADYMSWHWAEGKDWGTSGSSLEGEFGDIDQAQKTLQYRADLILAPQRWLGMEHRFAAGVQYQHQDVDYERLDDTYIYVSPARTTSCTNKAGITDTQTCWMGLTRTGRANTSNWPGQFFTSRTYYTRGRLDFQIDSWSAYAEDSIRAGRLSLRPGLRIDHDSYMRHTTVAPRLAMSLDLDAAGDTQLIAGANRYYGRNAATWRLRDGLDRLQYRNQRRPTLDSEWTAGTQTANGLHFDRLRIAYDDELMLGVKQQWKGWEFLGKVVSRKGRDQVVRSSSRVQDERADDPSLATHYETWSNDGRSETQIISLTVRPLRRLQFGGTSTTGLLALDWTDSRSSAPDYEDDFSTAYYENPIIRYDGSYIRYRDRPADNFTRPWTARLATTTHIPAARLTWGNTLRYRAGYRAIRDTGLKDVHDGQSVAVWERRRFAPSLIWDMRIGWEQPLSTMGTVFANVDVFNVLDRRAVNDVSSSVSRAPYYEMGRSFWLEVGYRF
ncbi:secretin and TonB N-terminal domain-containing protein [Stenotrophomonas sp. SMYL8]|uniref:secretin and TonB N-terminal domain-containing protein n=1 Tax=Stenotrophomonas sp. SMYL8 TaxID=3076041 RepID=UPI002E78AEEF|nr:secretin and TonB N-terminal domain-containing protein [Stenotrophomonas sp. SMYL8]